MGGGNVIGDCVGDSFLKNDLHVVGVDPVQSGVGWDLIWALWYVVCLFVFFLMKRMAEAAGAAASAMDPEPQEEGTVARLIREQPPWLG